MLIGKVLLIWCHAR